MATWGWLLQKSLRWSNDQAVNYKMKLAIMLSNVPHADRTFAPHDVLNETLWEPADIKQILHFQGLNLLSTQLPTLSAYVELTRLNLAGNKLKTLQPGLKTLTKLVVLDLHNNALTTTCEEFGALFNELPRLEIACVRGNARTRDIDKAVLQILGASTCRPPLRRPAPVLVN